MADSQHSKDPERVFLHDISTPVTVAVGMLEAGRDILAAKGGADPKAMECLEKSLSALAKISELIQNRRAEIRKKSEKP